MPAISTRASTAASRSIGDIKKLFHLDMLAAGQYISRRIMGNLSVETSEAEADAFCQAVEEFLVTRGDVVRAALPAELSGATELAPMTLAASSMSLTMASRASAASPFLSAFSSAAVLGLDDHAAGGELLLLDGEQRADLQPQRLDDLHQRRQARALIEAEVEFPVLDQILRTLGLARHLHLVVERRHAPDHVGR